MVKGRVKNQRKTASENVNNRHTNNGMSSEETYNSLTERQHWTISLALGAISTAVYIKCLYPSVPGGDSGELIAAGHELGVAHPPGYPLFTVMAWLTIHLVPVGSVAWRVNLMTALLSGGTVTCLSKAVLRLTRGRMSATVLAVGVWSWCKLNWTWSITAEVFSLNNFFVSLLMVLALYQEDSKGSCKIAMTGAFVCGLSLCNQHTMIVYVVCLAVWVLYQLHSYQRLSMILLVQIALSFLLGLTPYLHLPVSSYLQRSRWTWGDQRSFMGILTHLLRMEYGTFDLGKGESGKGLLFGLSFYSTHVLEDLTWVTAVLFCFGVCFAVYRFIYEYRHRMLNALEIFLVMMMLYILFFSWRANLDLTNPLYLGVVERFWMQSNIIVVAVAAVAYNNIFSYVSARYQWLMETLKVDLLIAILLYIYQLNRNYSVSDQSSNHVVLDFGKNILKSMPHGAILLTKGDLPSNTLRYLYLCENNRNDLQLFDQEVFTYEWSLPMLAWTSPNISFPGDMLYNVNGKRSDGKTTFDFKTFLNANYHRTPIVGCIGVQGHEDSWKSEYDLWPFGACFIFKKKKQKDAEYLSVYMKLISNLYTEWNYSHDGFSETSWEKVANEEMWNAKISAAFFLFDKATAGRETPDRDYLIHSYELYTAAFESNKDFPGYWHKNYALVCERMLHVQTKYSQIELLEKTIRHFKLSLEHEETGPQKEAIENAIPTLVSQLNRMKSGA